MLPASPVATSPVLLEKAGVKETATRSQFIDPLLPALGWDVSDEAGLGPRRDVVVDNMHRSETEVAGDEDWDDDLTEAELAARSTVISFPDYVHRIDLKIRLVVEAKKPSVNLRWKAPTFQAKSSDRSAAHDASHDGAAPRSGVSEA